jgi:hypothetical protein
VGAGARNKKEIMPDVVQRQCKWENNRAETLISQAGSENGKCADSNRRVMPSDFSLQN